MVRLPTPGKTSRKWGLTIYALEFWSICQSLPSNGISDVKATKNKPYWTSASLFVRRKAKLATSPHHFWVKEIPRAVKDLEIGPHSEQSTYTQQIVKWSAEGHSVFKCPSVELRTTSIYKNAKCPTFHTYHNIQ